MLYRCSEGVPRVINNLCESVLAAAAEAGATLVMPQLVQHVANEEFGLQPTLPPGSRSRPARKPAAEVEPPVARPTTTPKARVEVKPPMAAEKARIDSQPTFADNITTEFEPIAVVPFTPEPAVERPVAVEPLVAPNMVVDAAKPTTAVAPTVLSNTPKPAIVVPPALAADAAKAAVAVAPAIAADAIKPAVATPRSGVADTPKPMVTKPPAVVANTPKPVVTKPPAVVADTPKPVLTKPPAVVADTPKPVVTKPQAFVADSPRLAITEVAAAVPDELPLDDIPELIQDTQPELFALAGATDLPDLTDLVLPAKSNGSAKVTPKAKAASELTLPTLDDIPTLSGALRIDTRANAAPSKPAQAKPRQPNALSSKAELSKPVQAETARSISAQAKVVNEAPPAKMEEESKADTTITEIPAWDRDPTLAELKPDIEALEAALALVPESAGKPETKIDPKLAPANPKAKTKAAAHNFDLPEITLEKKLQVKEIEAQELRRKTGPPDTHEPELDMGVKRKHGFDLDRLAAELGKARSLEDVDDKLAETLFGEEMAQAAAEVAAMVAADAAAKNPPSEDPVKTAKAADALGAAAKPPTNVPPVAPSTAQRAPQQSNAKPAAAKAGPAAKNARVSKPMPPVKGPAVEITLATYPDSAPAPPSARATPEPIEDQFGTSMTATLKALSAAQMNEMDEPEPEEEEKPSRSLFGFFRGSS
jgi:hypothetical protein